MTRFVTIDSFEKFLNDFNDCEKSLSFNVASRSTFTLNKVVVLICSLIKR